MEIENMDETGSRTNSFQRKKPPWLKLDIPTIQLTPDDTPQIAQPVKRGRSVSMPGESPHTHIAALEASNNYLKPPVERMPFMQSIKRFDTNKLTHLYERLSALCTLSYSCC
ncbi:hypothetical protein XENORESO_012833 [Xenotaenia resolanae]|uniref:Inactive rhomboid protein 1 n=1 Tax=Xenotaenia resolanae TaxID=208358 RepID=A0ABV0W8P8_9TELE